MLQWQSRAKSSSLGSGGKSLRGGAGGTTAGKRRSDTAVRKCFSEGLCSPLTPEHSWLLLGFPIAAPTDHLLTQAHTHTHTHTLTLKFGTRIHSHAHSAKTKHYNVTSH